MKRLVRTPQNQINSQKTMNRINYSYCQIPKQVNLKNPNQKLAMKEGLKPT